MHFGQHGPACKLSLDTSMSYGFFIATSPIQRFRVAWQAGGDMKVMLPPCGTALVIALPSDFCYTSDLKGDESLDCGLSSECGRRFRRFTRFRGVNAGGRAKMQSSSSVADTDPGVRSRFEVQTRGGFAVKIRTGRRGYYVLQSPSRKFRESSAPSVH